MISVVSPFFNEEQILESGVQATLDNLVSLGESWEYILVNDGSTDRSLEVARELAAMHPQLRLVTYDRHRGRGHALTAGIRAARGRLIFTTEIDSSWDADIIRRMYGVLCDDPEADIVIASPHLRRGGYKNVPWQRVLLSRVGNVIIRMGLSFRTTMNTGMTRGYRREVIQSLPLFNQGKDFHLEVLIKAHSLHLRVIEIPATIEWQHKSLRRSPIRRRSSTRIRQVVSSHLLFSAVAVPIRYLWSAAAANGAAATTCGIYAGFRYVWNEPYAFAGLGAVGFSVFAVVLFSLGVVSEQNRLLLTEMWRVQSMLQDRSGSVTAAEGSTEGSPNTDEPAPVSQTWQES